jgi:diguanylate cyclase (GGDEF)-like protein
MNFFLRSSSSLARILILPFVVLILVLSLLIGMLSYMAGRNAVVEVAQQMLDRTTERVALTVTSHLDGTAAVLEAAFPHGMAVASSIDSELDALRTRFWIATSLHAELDNYVYYGNQHGDFVGVLRPHPGSGEWQVKHADQAFSDIYDCTSISCVLTTPKRRPSNYDPRQRPWYLAARQHDQDSWSGIYVNYTNRELVVTRVRRILTNKGRLEGVAATDVPLRTLNKFVRDIHVSNHGVVFIVEPDGKLVASSIDGSIFATERGEIARTSALDSSAPLIRAAFASLQKRLDADQLVGGGDRGFTFQGEDGAMVYGSYAWIRDAAGLTWLTVVAVPRGDFLQTLDNNVRWTIVIVIVAVALALLLGLSVVHWVVRDVRRLSGAAARIGKGQMNVALKIQRSDEIGQLANDFMAMQAELNTDKLTGVTSRAALMRYLDAAVSGIDRRHAERSEKFTVMFLDLDRFKAINDKLGHEYGDLALIEVGQRLRTIVREDDVVARFGGDEFVLVFWGVADDEFVAMVRNKILTALSVRLLCLQGLAEGQAMTVGASIGTAFYPRDAQDTETLIKLADQSMYEDKAAGRRMVCSGELL